MDAAIIDIGSNSIRLLCGQTKRVTTTRLARGIDKTHLLCEESIEATLAVIRQYQEEAQESSLPVFAYATSAVRDAKNREEFVNRVKAECGLEIDVLTGEREALYAFCAVDGEGLLEIGGGSSQLVTEEYAASFPMGCVRAREWARAAGETLEVQREALYARCGQIYKFPRFRIDDWVGVGGTVTTLAAMELGLTRYDPIAVNRAVLTLKDMPALIEKLWAMDRPAHPLLLQRHDVIVYGALLLEFMMRGMSIPSLRVSDRDGLEGYLMMLKAE